MGNVVEFISYEGGMRAIDGPAVKRDSEDIGIAQNEETPLGLTLQRQGLGTESTDFQWHQADSSPGTLNADQTIFVSIRLPEIGFLPDFIF